MQHTRDENNQVQKKNGSTALVMLPQKKESGSLAATLKKTPTMKGHYGQKKN
jgi:hypothetical protein